MRYGLRLLLILMLISPPLFAVARPIANPQLQMIGGRYQSLGGTNPALIGDISGIFINPATVGTHQPMLMTFSHQKLMGFYDYKMLAGSMPMELLIPMEDKSYTQKVVLGFAYGSSMLSQIPRTEKYNGRISEVGSYAAGFDMFESALGIEYYDALGFDRISGGLGLKLVRQFIDKDIRSGFGLDLGTNASYTMDKYYIDRLHFGVSVLNFLSTPMTWSGAEEASLPFQVFFGVGADMLDDQLSVYLHNALDGFGVAAEWAVNHSFVLRTASNFKEYSLGTGLLFDSISGFGGGNYGLRIDYNYSQNMYPFDGDPDNTFTVSILGETRARTPEILVPQEAALTNNTVILLSGVGPKQTTIRIYNNDALVRSTTSDRYGRWRYKYFPLQEGKNVVSIRAYSLESDISYESEKRMLVLDTIPPSIIVTAEPEDKKLRFYVNSPTTGISEAMDRVEGLFGTDRMAFTRKTDYMWESIVTMPVQWQDRSPVVSKMSQIKIFAVDKIGNETGIQTIPFYYELLAPKDKFVHYQEYLRFMGQVSAMVKSLKLDGVLVNVDSQSQFSVMKRLKPGKNLVALQIETPQGAFLNYTCRILRLITFPDLTKKVKARREIEFLATLGVLDADTDGNFHPELLVTRSFLTRMIVKVANLKLPDKVTEAPFPDVPADDKDAKYILAAVQEGLVFAYPDGTFKPDQPLTLAEAIYLLSNAGVIDEQEAPAGANQQIKRADLAQFLAYTAKYEIKIERLIDWEKGYFE